jgi:hypothetical protein
MARWICAAALGPCPGDAKGDGVVNFADVNEVFSNFGAICPQ